VEDQSIARQRLIKHVKRTQQEKYECLLFIAGQQVAHQLIRRGQGRDRCYAMIR
jgi:hypothetical protein